MKDVSGCGAAVETQQSAGLNSEQEWELAHFMGRLYVHGRKLLARASGLYLQTGALELELAVYSGVRGADRPKWLSAEAADEPIRAATRRALEDFKAGVTWGE